MTPSYLRSQARHKKTSYVWYGSCCAAGNAHVLSVISRFTSRLSPRFRTGQRQARRLGTSLALIFRQMANTLLLATLVDVFCYITSKIMMHTGGHDDQELYITSILYTCLRVCTYQVAGAAQTSRKQRTSNRRQRQTQLEHPEARATSPPDQERITNRNDP